MSADFMQQPFPRGLLAGAATLVLFTLLAVAWARVAQPSAAPYAGADEAASAALLRFTDRADGAIVVHDLTADRPAGTIAPASGYFVRATLRALSRDRKLGNASPDEPFELRTVGNGRLLLIDTSNGRVVDLAAFGSANVAAFAAFLPPDETP
jgi:putative photosynthetic complex assembly protein